MKSKLTQSPSDRARDRDHVRVVVSLRALLRAGGRDAELRSVDLEAWAAEWMQLPAPGLNGESPAQALRHPGGWPRVEQILERMAGGLCA